MTEAYTVRPMSPIRRMIAARTLVAKQTVPHFRLCADLELDALLTLRRRLVPATGVGSSRSVYQQPSLTDFMIKASAAALMEMPVLNVQWVDGEIRRLESADIAVVVALDEGLSTPIIRHAEQKSVWQISQELKDLTRRARDNLLKAAEVFGGSFGISNLGMFGVPEFDAIINPPQCAMLAVGAARATVLPGADSATRVASVLRVTLSCDHRVIDGASGARFLSGLKQQFEHPGKLGALFSAPPA